MNTVSDRISPEERTTRFANACTLVGGKRAMGRVLNINERRIRAFCTGEEIPHDNIMADVAEALRCHGKLCREYAGLSDPFFARNRLRRPPKGADPKCWKDLANG